MNRKVRRDLEKRMGKQASDNLAEKIFQFDKLPETCNACQKSFDKKDKDMVQSWNVVVRPEVVRIFCPECVRKTKHLHDIQEIINEHR